MMNLKVVVSLFLLISLFTPLKTYAEVHNQNTNDSGDRRSDVDEKNIPKQYGDLEKLFKPTDSAQTKIEVTEFGKEAVKRTVTLSDKREKAKANVISSREDFLAALKKVKDYREKMITGKWCKEDDQSAKKFSALMDEYIQYLADKFKEGDTTFTKLNEKKLYTYTMGLRHIMETKATSFENVKVKFEKSDKSLNLGLDEMVTVLLGGASRLDAFNSNSEFSWEKLKEDPETKEIVAKANEAKEDLIKMHQATATKDGSKLCKVDSDPTAPVASNGSTAGSATAGAATAGGATAGGATAGAATAGGATAGGATAGAATAGGSTAGGVTAGAPTVDPGLGVNEINNEGNVENNGPAIPFGSNNVVPNNPAVGNPLGVDPAAAENFRRLLDDQARQRLIDEEDRAEDDDLLRQALGQLGQIQPPSSRTNSPSREESNQGPQISPSLDVGSKGQQQPFTPPQFPVPAPQGLAGLPPGLFQTPQVPLIPMPEPKRWDNDSPRVPPPPVEDPRTTALMEMLKVQQQMLGNAIQQGSIGQNPYGNVANINRLNGGVAARGGVFGRGRVATNSLRRGLPGRGGRVFRGTAKGGSLGALSTSPNSRARVPSRIK